MSEPKHFSLATQIAEVKRELGERPGVYQRARVKDGALKIAIMESVLRTLIWLFDNEDRIKAKAATDPDAVEMLPAVESTNVYKMGNAMFIDMAKGGWEHRYTITDEAGNVIGTKIEGAETRGSKPYVEFVPVGFRTFKTPQEFIAAYERGEWKAREAAPA